MLAELTIQEFLADLSSNKPAPGGGSAAALAATIGSALATMVCNLTIGNPRFGQVQDEVGSIAEQAAQLSALLQQYMDEDAKAFSSVIAAYQLPKTTEEEKTRRTKMIQASLKEASIVPLKIAQVSLDVLKLADKIVAIGNPHAVSDAAIAGIMGYAGVQGSLYNVKINIVLITDNQFVQDMKMQMQKLQQQAEETYRTTVAKADSVIG